MVIPIGSILIVLILLAVLFYVLRSFPIPEPVRTIIVVCAVVLVCLWLVQALGIASWSLRLPG